MQMTKDLLTNDIDGALVDNYIITHFLKFIREEPIRVEKYIEHPIIFGAVLSKNSSILEKCMRQYSADHPHEIFESIAEHLTPLKVSRRITVIGQGKAALSIVTHYSQNVVIGQIC